VPARTPLDRLRAVCLALPEAHEVVAWGEPTFRVKNKVFAMYASAATHHGAGRPGVWIKTAHVTQDMLVRAEPARYYVPPYCGKAGWTGAFLDKKPDWSTISDLLRDGWKLTAPKKLLVKAGSGEPAKQRR
jgi:hypothetical protein